jgi:hypothetical protein
MKESNNRSVFLAGYAALCILFWLPYLRCLVIQGPILDSFGRPRLWAALLVPSVPLAVCFPRIPMSDIRAVLGQPVYLALLFWPLLALGIKPGLWHVPGWRGAIIAYSICFACAMVIAAAFGFMAVCLGPC